MWHFLTQTLFWKLGQSIARGQCCTNQCLPPFLASILTALFSPCGYRLHHNTCPADCRTDPIDHVLTFHFCVGDKQKQISLSVSVQSEYQSYSHPATYPQSPLSAHDTSAALQSEPAEWCWGRPGYHLLIYSCGEKENKFFFFFC